jgi:hypothetical protein
MFYDRLSRLQLVSELEPELAETCESTLSGPAGLRLISAQLLVSAGSELEQRQH